MTQPTYIATERMNKAPKTTIPIVPPMVGLICSRIGRSLRGGAVILLFLSSFANAQLWSGVLSSARATDWTGAGVVGGIPSYTVACATQPSLVVGIGNAAANTTSINAAIASCDASHNVVSLAAGTYNFAGVDFAHKSNVVLRGAGANSTFLIATSGSSVSCFGLPSLICVFSTDNNYFGSNTPTNWTAGFSQGTTAITVASTTGITVGKIIVLNQLDETTDNGNFFNCSLTYASPGASGGCSYNGPDSGNGTTGRFQQEMFQVTAVNSGTGVVTLDHGLRNPNWAIGQTPQAWVFTPITSDGIEDLSIDGSANSTIIAAIEFYNALNVWVKGVRIVKANITPIWQLDTVHATFEQNYFYSSQAADSFGVRSTAVSDTLIQNNIVQQIRVAILDEGPDNAPVIGYNFFINQLDNVTPSDSMWEAVRPHSGGDNYLLMEGNIANNYYGEDYHGTHLMQTSFRNFFTGWESCATSGICGASPSKDYQTQAFMLDAYNRYTNEIGDVLGTPGYHTSYQVVANNAQAPTPGAVYNVGNGNGGLTTPVPGDSVVSTTFFRWGNYNSVDAVIRFCGNSSDTGWVATCGSTSEVPSGISPYPNSIPTLGDTGIGQGALPVSFYLSGKPVWWPNTIPWPPIGPGVTSGTLGQCSGTVNVANQFNRVAALSNSQCGNHGFTANLNGGHINPNPAMACALNTMGMPPDGSGSALAFDRTLCYATAAQSAISGSINGGAISGGAYR